MKNLLLIFVLLFTASASAQRESGRIRIDFNKFCYYDRTTKLWSEWEDSDNTFIFNYNERGDIAHLTPSGETVIYKKVGAVTTEYLDGKNKYKTCEVIDKDGESITILLFEDYELGLKMIMGNFIAHFSGEIKK